MHLRILIPACCAALLACAGPARTASQVMTREALVQKAKAYIADNHPDWTRAFSLPPVVRDMGACWEVGFELPKGFAGGTPVVEIDKASGAVIRAYHGQ